MTRTSQLKPPTPITWPAYVEPQDDYSVVKSMAMRVVIEQNDMDRAIHVENYLLGTLTDLLSARGSKVDAFFSAELACARLAAETLRDHPGQDYVIGSLLGDLPVVVEVYEDVVELRAPSDAEMP